MRVGLMRARLLGVETDDDRDQTHTYRKRAVQAAW